MIDASKFCPICYKKLMKQIVDQAGNKNVYVDVTGMKFGCRIPIFTSDLYGNPMVRVKDCVNDRIIEMPLKTWQEKRARGEL